MASVVSCSLAGIIPPMVTPLRSQEALDEEALSRLVEHLIGGGVSGLFLLGTTGECASLSRHVRMELVQRVCRLVDGRVSVLVGVTDAAVAESVTLAECAADAGATAIVAALPFYYPLDQTEVRSHFELLAEESSLPLMLYNYPVMTKTAIAPDTVGALATHDNIVGMKDSSGDLEYLAAAIEAARGAKRFEFSVGPELLLPEAIRLGCVGSVCAGANLFPRLFVAWFEALRDGRTDDAAALGVEASRLNAEVYGADPTKHSLIPAVKAALAALGVCRDTLALPLLPCEATSRRQIADNVRAMHERLAGVQA